MTPERRAQIIGEMDQHRAREKYAREHIAFYERLLCEDATRAAGIGDVRYLCARDPLEGTPTIERIGAMRPIIWVMCIIAALCAGLLIGVNLPLHW